MLPIAQAPNDVLSSVTQKVEKIDASIHKLIEEMVETLAHTTDPKGIGLAAPQVGRSLQLFIVKPTAKAKVTVYINPVITLKNTEQEIASETEEKKDDGKKLEGCLSLKDIWGEVKRAPVVTISYQDEHGHHHTRTFKDFTATIIQHEYDHLQGILFPKRVLEQKGMLYKSHKDEKGKEVFEEINL